MMDDMRWGMGLLSFRVSPLGLVMQHHSQGQAYRRTQLQSPVKEAIGVSVALAMTLRAARLGLFGTTNDNGRCWQSRARGVTVQPSCRHPPDRSASFISPRRLNFPTG